MINLYEKLGISIDSNSTQIQRAIKKAAENQSMSLAEIQKAHDWLLDANIRKKYNAKLFAEYPELIEQLAQQRATQNKATLRQSKSNDLSKNKLAIAAMALVVLIGGYYVLSPYWALRQLANAVDNSDVGKMSQYIDYPAVKDSISSQFKAAVLQKINNDAIMKDNPMAMAIALPMIDDAVDMMVSEAGIRTLFNGQKHQKRKEEAEAEGKELRLRKADLDYQGLDRMHATITSEEGKKVTFVFEREGFADWKMKSVQLYLDDLDL